MSTRLELSPEFRPLLDELAAAPENVREMWRYAMVLMMIDDEKARVLTTRAEHGQDTKNLTLFTLQPTKPQCRPAGNADT